jgi:tripartite-type tricarboxylate transporter receptor subunit TctC
MVVPWPPGQATDLAGRLLAQALSQVLAQPVVVDNRGGAGGMIGTDNAAKSPPDGYTILAASSGPVTVNPLLRRTPYDPDKELAPVAMVGNSPYVLTTRPNFPASTVAEFIQVVRASPGRYTFASSGTGATAHLIAESFNRRAGLQSVHVPFNGSAPGMTALAAGQVDYNMETLAGALPLIRGGEVKVLGISLLNGSTLAPEIPPISRVPGLEGFDMGAWLGIMTPMHTPASIVTRLVNATRQAMQSGDLREKIGVIGVEPDFRETDAFARHLGAQRDMFGAVARVTEIRLD